jgi:integration host factor subunit alpha
MIDPTLFSHFDISSLNNLDILRADLPGRHAWEAFTPSLAALCLLLEIHCDISCRTLKAPIEFAGIKRVFTLIFEEQSMTLTKAHIVEALFAKNIFTKTQAAQVIDALFELIKQSLQNGEDVLSSGFGRFSVKGKYQRIGRNPQTGEPMTLPAKKVVTFKCSDVLRAAMNGKED